MDSGLIALTLFGILIAYVAFKFFTQSFADFLDKGARETMWIWLPFLALGLLLKRLREKYKK